MSEQKSAQRSNFSVLIAALGLLALLLVGGYRVSVASGAMRALTVLMLVMYGTWILAEFRITTSEASKDTSRDRHTCETYAIARSLTVLAAFGFAPLWSSVGVWLPVGLALFIGGVVLRSWAIFTLGRSYSHRVRTPADSAIVSCGPYRHLRHPAYSGMLLAHVGLAVLFYNWFVLVALLAVFLPALVRRIRVEEQHLLAIPDYRAFATHRARLAPGVW